MHGRDVHRVVARLHASYRSYSNRPADLLFGLVNVFGPLLTGRWQ